MRNKTRIAAIVLLVLFADLNLVALYYDGLGGLTRIFSEANLWTWVIAADLCIALGTVLTWLWQDARRRGHSPLPYVLLTLCTGSIGTLLYLSLHPPVAAEA